MNTFKESLLAYRRNLTAVPSPDHVEQNRLVDRFLELAQDGVAALDRKHAPGHFTGAALVTDFTLSQVLLTLHAKLDRWLQLGGHADGDPNLAQVALRECKEESGLAKVEFFPLSDIFDFEEPSPTPLIFDLDIHTIPARKTEPEHLHYDVRYLFMADARQPLVVSSESKDLKWVPLSDAYGLSKEWSTHRQFDKLAWCKKHWARA